MFHLCPLIYLLSLSYVTGRATSEIPKILLEKFMHHGKMQSEEPELKDWSRLQPPCDCDQTIHSPKAKPFPLGKYGKEFSPMCMEGSVRQKVWIGFLTDENPEHVIAKLGLSHG